MCNLTFYFAFAGPTVASNVSILEQNGLPWVGKLTRRRMSVIKHIPDTSPGPTGTSCLGYPRGTWPPLTLHSAPILRLITTDIRIAAYQGVLADATPIGDKAGTARAGIGVVCRVGRAIKSFKR